jgi:hypothetical protein
VNGNGSSGSTAAVTEAVLGRRFGAGIANAAAAAAGGGGAPMVLSLPGDDSWFLLPLSSLPAQEDTCYISACIECTWTALPALLQMQQQLLCCMHIGRASSQHAGTVATAAAAVVPAILDNLTDSTAVKCAEKHMVATHRARAPARCEHMLCIAAMAVTSSKHHLLSVIR